MNRKSAIVGGIILILLGLLFLASEIFPGIFSFWSWPFILVTIGLVFLIWAIFSGTGGLAVPGMVLSGLGGIFYYQTASGNWTSWSYIWALIPGFVGLGILLGGLIDRKFKNAINGGLTLLLISAVMFFAFGYAFGLRHDITMYWPVLLVILGVVALVRALTSKKRYE
jgi:hypothetical protein